MNDQQQVLLKIVSVGDSQVGKSCLIKRYCEGRFVNKYITTIGVDYGVKKMSVNGKRAAINFFDLSGDEDYSDIRNPFFQDSQGILLVFDLENKESFKNLSRWEKLMKDSGVDPKRSVTIVVGNKSDSKNKVRIILNPQEVTNEEVTKYVKSKGYEYFQSSASTGENVAEVMDQIDEQKKQLK